MTLIVRTPVIWASDHRGGYQEKKDWLVSHGLQIVTQTDALGLFQPGLMQPGEWGMRLADELPRYYSHGVYQDHMVDARTFIPSWLVWHFPPWATNEAMLFKLTFAGT